MKLPTQQQAKQFVTWVTAAIAALALAITQLRVAVLGDKISQQETAEVAKDTGPHQPDPLVISLQEQIDSLRRYHE